jgi:hypothetical protein
VQLAELGHGPLHQPAPLEAGCDTDLPDVGDPLLHPVYLLSAGVVFFGLREVGIFETVGAVALIACVAVLALGAAGMPLDVPMSVEGTPAETLALFGMVMYGYYAFFSVPQVVRGLAPDGRAAARSVAAGLAVNGLLIATVAFIAVGVSNEVTEVAMVGIRDELGMWAGGVGASSSSWPS